MSSVILLALCLGAGIIARAVHPPEGTAPALNWWVINIALPAATLAAIPTLTASADLWFLVVPTWIGLIAAFLIIGAIGRALGWSARRTGAVVLVAGLGNTSFIGYPLLDALRGHATLPYAVVTDQLGTFAALSTLGVWIAARASGARSSGGEMLRKVALFPPLIALVIGVVVNIIGGWPPALAEALTRIGATLSPVAVFTVGLRFNLRAIRGEVVPVAIALGWKLLVLPLATLGIGIGFGVSGPVFIVGVLQTAMAPMISAAILAERDGLDGELANSILALGIVIAFGTVVAWNALLP